NLADCRQRPDQCIGGGLECGEFAGLVVLLQAGEQRVAELLRFQVTGEHDADALLALVADDRGGIGERRAQVQAHRIDLEADPGAQAGAVERKHALLGAQLGLEVDATHLDGGLGDAGRKQGGGQQGTDEAAHRVSLFLQSHAASGGAQVQRRISPLPNTIHFWLVRPSSPTGPRAWILSVEMPISAPRPYSKPSAKRVEALTITELESTSVRKRRARP